MYTTASNIICLLFASQALAWWKPKPGTDWEIILSKRIIDVGVDNLPPVMAIDSDLEKNTAAAWAQLKNRNYSTICYFSAGSWESFREDRDDLPPEVRGAPLEPPFEDELWLDVRQPLVLDVMKKRMDMAVQKGCDAVDPDNLDAYDNDNGFGLTEQDAITYIRQLSTEAHNRNLAIGLKNSVGITMDVLDAVDFQVNEQCQEFEDPDEDYIECKEVQPFIDADKAVFRIEYEANRPSQSRINEICNYPFAAGFSTLIKKINLDEVTWRDCLR